MYHRRKIGQISIGMLSCALCIPYMVIHICDRVEYECICCVWSTRSTRGEWVGMDGFTGVFGVFLLRDSAMVVLCGAKRTLKGTKNWRCQADSKRIKAFHTASERVVNVQSVTVTYHAIAAHTDSSLLIFSHSPSYSIATFSTIKTRKAAFSYIFTQNIPCAPRCSRCSRCVSEFPSVS